MNFLLNQFLACRRTSDYYQLQILAECDALPSELADMLRYADVLPEPSKEWATTIRRQLHAQAPAIQPYRRQAIVRNVVLYTTRTRPEEPRDLLIAFCGLVDRLQLPIPVVLQHLDGSRYDVLLLRDPSQRIYLQGVPGYAPDLKQVADRIGRDLDLGRYRSIRSFGTSGGGWAAFTVGAMLGADRAISMSGKPPSATFRLAKVWEARGYSLDEQEADFAVFERLFNAIPDRSTRLLAFYGADFDADREGAEAFERMVGATGIGFRGVATHNLMFEILKAPALATFLDRYLTGDLGQVVPPAGQRMLDMESLGQPPDAAPEASRSVSAR
jgi:hypothetical protein